MKPSWIALKMVVKPQVLVGVTACLLIGALVIALTIYQNCSWEAKLSSVSKWNSIESEEKASFKESLLLSAAEFGDVVRVKDLLVAFQHGMSKLSLGCRVKYQKENARIHNDVLCL